VNTAGPKTAMVLAAGLGTRMRPLTDAIPKALIPVAGRTLLDRVLDKLAEAGVERAVVNVHHFADQVEAHLKGRTDLEVLISDERAGLLDSGGGIQHARALLGEDPIFLANIDSLWLEGATPALEALKRAWDPAAMDLLLLLVARGNGIGFEGPQGFLMDEAGRLTHSTSSDVVTPFANVGFGILKPQVLDGETGAAFSIHPTWHRLQAQGRLHGVVMDAFWMHVGDPAARDAAEARLG
jgi:MurNAc alpha-1-phosphate uridylyltransferase